MNEQLFHNVADFLDLDEQTFQRMLPDLIKWHRLSRKALFTLKEMGAVEDIKSVQSDFVWVDDGNPGNCKEVRVNIKQTNLV
ncbi:MAG: hypothetical protein M1492_03505 [Gammaproteobacteria bacterium]|nr:hypothetical protein [Gammaproteobacteria bacterium]